MNIFREFEDKIKACYKIISKQNNYPNDLDLSKCVIELPRDEAHGDLASNIALVLAKPLLKNPKEIAELFVTEIEKEESVIFAKIAGPGFINIYLDQSRWGKEIADILDKGIEYGKNNLGVKQNINIEFVSANPTGPLHAAHARGAILGDVLANLMNFSGYNVTREYYINDAGSQIDTLSKSAFLRYCESLGETSTNIPEGLYPGDYLIEVGEYLASKFKNKIKYFSEDEVNEEIGPIVVDIMMDLIKKDL